MVLVTGALTALAGCSSTASLDADRATRLLADHIPVWAGGEPSSLRPVQMPPKPLDIFDGPPARPEKPLNADEQKKVQSDLVALRNRTLAQGKAAQAVDPSGLPTLSADRHNGAEHARRPTPVLQASAVSGVQGGYPTAPGPVAVGAP